MPDPTDDIVEIPVPVSAVESDGQPVEESDPMADPVDLSPNVANIMLSRSLQVGGLIETNSAEINKLLTFDHLENKRMVSLQQSLGAREVQSKETPGGPANANKP